jgi:hypothetical protein
VSADIAADFDVFIDECFANGTDPYGNQWEELAEATVERKGFATPLEESGKLRNETGAFPLKGAGIEFHTAPYGFFHQSSTVNMPARKYLPDEPELPIAWSSAIDARLAAAFGKAGRSA